MVEQQIVRALVELADPLRWGPDGATFLERVCVRCTELFRLDAVAVHLTGEDESLRVVAVSRSGARLGRWLEELAGGPAAEVLRTGEAVHLADPAEERTRGWAATLGLPPDKATLLAVPMLRRAEPVGVLTLVRGARPSLAADEVAAVQALADVAATTLTAIRALDEARRLAGQLESALESRVVIEQAKGVIATRDAVDVHEAFDRLRRYARNHHRRLHEVARDVVDGRLILTA